jgi:hypothetical protein
MNMSAHFCKNILVIQQFRYQFLPLFELQCLTMLMSPFQNFLLKLKEHLLPRLLTDLQSQTSSSQNICSVNGGNISDLNTILFKHDRMYRHNLARINYTSYDVRRSEDVVNASTPHHNIMVLSNLGDENSPITSHPFKYAQVLGIYHVNAIYVGPGMTNYQTHRMEFLWVRWYQITGTCGGWDNRKLDRIQFAAMSAQGTFGFLDPADVLRACHVIPAFAKGVLHIDGMGLSHCAQDSKDWVEYYVNR